MTPSKPWTRSVSYLALAVVAGLWVSCGGNAQPTDPISEPSAAARFFTSLSEKCGGRFEGKATFPDEPTDAFRDKLLIATIETCSADELRIPFWVGDDKSRTWLLTLAGDRLELKHDHRHPDGTPDEVTMYGGTSKLPGTPLRQSFPADAYTADLIPEAATNEWFLSISEDGGELTYYLERHGEPRFEAVLFDPVHDGGDPTSR